MEGKMPSTTPRALTDFEQILLGVIGERAMSGYDLKLLFRSTPAGVYEPGSGALYPALLRLERRGFLHAEAATSGRRRRRLYRATPVARAATRRWVREPIDPASVGRELGLHLMRFVVMERIVAPSEVYAFLEGLAHALEAFVERMELAAASTSLPGRHPRLALEHGIEVHRASLGWTRSAMAALALPPGGEIHEGSETVSRDAAC
jgi:DNA-binding PadR family transcriptional regulator